MAGKGPYKGKVRMDVSESDNQGTEVESSQLFRESSANKLDYDQ